MVCTSFVRVLATIWLALSLFCTWTLGFVAQVVLWLVFWPFFLCCPRFREVCQGFCFRCASVAGGVWLNPAWKIVVVRGPPKDWDPKKRRTILMANHLSGSDPWVLSSTFFPWEMKYAYKASLHMVPIAGWSIRLAGDLAIYFTKDRGGWGVTPEDIRKMMDRAATLLRMNIGLAVFPEGTRSMSGRLQGFKDGFFRLATEVEDTYILPAALMNTDVAWPLNEKTIACATAYVVYGDPILAEGKSVEELKSEVRDAIICLQKEAPCFDPVRHEPLQATEMSSMRGHGIEG